MNTSTLASTGPYEHTRALTDIRTESLETSASAVSWAAILAGAAAAASLSLILLILGTGLGLSSVSPWAYHGVSAATFGTSTIIWLAFTQMMASGMGGFLAGRLRTRWDAVQTDEVYFRDTAHGFLAWAIATLATAVLLTSVIAAIVSSGVRSELASLDAPHSMRADKAKPDQEIMKYFVDSLFRINLKSVQNPEILIVDGLSTKSPDAIIRDATPEASRIFYNALQIGSLPLEDKRYLGQIIAQNTGLTLVDGENRVVNIYTRLQTRLVDEKTSANNLADASRKASVNASLWLFISLLIGAFIASFAAIFGGRMRDL